MGSGYLDLKIRVEIYLQLIATFNTSLRFLKKSRKSCNGFIRPDDANAKGLCDKLDLHSKLFTRTKYFGSEIPIGGTAHQAGTLRFGTDPQTSVLDVNCKAHDLHNLYVTDASFFPSIGAVNPTLTIIANALRVSEVIAQRIK